MACVCVISHLNISLVEKGSGHKSKAIEREGREDSSSSNAGRGSRTSKTMRTKCKIGSRVKNLFVTAAVGGFSPTSEIACKATKNVQEFLRMSAKMY